MKLLLVIDSLGSGGAQRQVTNLAIGLKEKGHQVEVFNYYPKHDFYRSALENSKIKIIDLHGKGKGFSIKVVRRLSMALRAGKYDLAISFLNSPSLYLELSHFFSPLTPKVASERNSIMDHRGRGFLRHFHRFSSCVVVNSKSHFENLRQAYPFLQNELTVIYNGVDTRLFSPASSRSRDDQTLKLLGIGRISPQKNLILLIESLRTFYQAHDWVPEFNWVGRVDQSSKAQRAYWNSIEEALGNLPPEVQGKINFLGEQKNVPELLNEADALILASSFEGLPNVVCEALSCGRPVLASDVSDNRILIEDGIRGFLFDPSSRNSIAESIARLAKLNPAQRIEMSRRCREFAEKCLANEIMVGSYERLFAKLLESRVVI